MDAYLVPTERPPRLLDVKSALLGYDKVVLPSPDDRELIPPIALMAATTGFSFIGVHLGPVLPLGKTADYGIGFDLLESELKAAGNPSQIEIESTRVGFEQREPGITIGGVPIPEGWPNPAALFGSFRFLAQHEDVLSSSLRGLDPVFEWPIEDVEKLVLPGRGLGAVSSQILQVPQVPEVTINLPGEELRPLLTKIACARVGTAVKSLFVSYLTQDRVPYTSDEGVASVIGTFQALQQGALSGGEEQSSLDKNEAIRVALTCALDLHVDQDRLRDMSIRDVLRLRTKAWGEHQAARRAFLERAEDLAAQCSSQDEFAAACEESFRLQREKAAALADDWKTLGLRFSCRLFGSQAVPAIAERLVTIDSFSMLAVAGLVAIGATASDIAQAYSLYRRARREAGSTQLAIARPFEPFLKPHPCS